MPILNDNEEAVVAPVDLDRVHELTTQKLEAEVVDEPDEPKELDDAPKDEEPKDEDKDTGTGDDGTKDDEDKDDEPDEVVPPVVAKVDEVVPDEPIIDTDITKDGTGKISVVDSEGNTFYFNNMNEVPDDFEPESYKAWGVFTSNMAIKVQSDAKAAEERQIAQNAKQQQAEIDAVTESWDKDIDVLTKGGVLPADKKERETAIGDTYAYIASKLGDGIVIDSFAEAHKAMMYDRHQEQIAKEKEAKAKIVKEKGAKILSGTGGISGKPKSPEALPVGTSLDAVHARFSGLI